MLGGGGIVGFPMQGGIGGGGGGVYSQISGSGMTTVGGQKVGGFTTGGGQISGQSTSGEQTSGLSTGGGQTSGQSISGVKHEGGVMVPGCSMQIGLLTSTHDSGQLQLLQDEPEEHALQLQWDAVTSAMRRRARKIFFISYYIP